MTDWTCQACNGPIVPLGVLGTREHGRCRLCGLNHSRPVAVDGDDVGPAQIDPEDLILRDEEGETFNNDWKPRP